MTTIPEVELLERDDELDVLVERLDRAAAGEGGFAHLLGPAGVGKTSLVRALARHARERGMLVLEASAGAFESRSPHGLVRRLFDRAIVDLGSAERAALSAGPARLAMDRLLGGDHGPIEQDDLLASLYWLLDGLARRRPLLFVADDLQWADDESLVFLASLRERLRVLPVLVVSAVREARAEERRPLVAALLADRDATLLRLEPLSRTAVGALLARDWGEPVGPSVAEAAFETTGGNPFLVRALAQLLGGLAPKERTAELVRDAVPSSVTDSVVERMAALSEQDRALARAVAVLDAGPLRVAGELAGLDLDEAAASADRLRATGLFADDALGYRHALLRAAVHAAIGPESRELLHRRAAALLASDGPDALHAAAAHLLASEGVADPWAVDLLRRAATEAMAAGGPHATVALLRRAVAEPAPAEQLPALLRELGRAEARIADPAAVTTLQRAMALPPDPDERLQSALALATVYGYAGQHEAAADALERALAGPGAADPELELTTEAALVAASLLVPGRVQEARRRLAARAGLSGATRGERLFLIQQMSDAVGANQPAAVIRDYAHRVIGDWDSPEQSPESTEWVWARLYLLAIGDYAEVRELTDRGFARAEAKGSVIGLVTASFVRGRCDFSSGALADAEARFRTMLDLGAAAGGFLVQSLGSGELAQTLALQGRVDEALELLEPFPEELPPDAPVNGAATIGFARAITRHAAGDHEGALRAARYVGRIMAELGVDSPTWAEWRAAAVGPLLALGRVEEARTLAAEHLALCEQSEVAHSIGTALRLCAQATADPEEALGMLRRSVEVLATSENRFAEGMSRVALGGLLRRTGMRREARVELREGRRLVAPSGARGLLEWADAELAVAGARHTGQHGAGPAPLTPAERRVAELAAAGQRNVEIARGLFIATKTVETHLARAYRKLGVARREELAAALERE